MSHHLFKDLSWPERVVFVALAFTVVSITLWWRLGIVAVCVLAGLSVIKMFYTRTFGNRSLTLSQRVCLWAMVAYWLLYALSALVSSNHTEGWFRTVVKLYFLIIPLLCLLADTSYLTRTRIKALFQVFTATLLVRFAVCLVISGFQLVQGVPAVEVRDWQDDPLGMHHNYLALYIDAAVVFLYGCIIYTPKEKRRRNWPLLFGALVVLAVYLFMSSSRSGIVTLILFFALALVHLTFFRKKYKVAIVITLVSLVFSAGLYFVEPSAFSRFEALAHWDENHVPDDRVIAWECGVKAIEGHLMFGYGVGDCSAQLREKFEERGYRKAVDVGYNSHNQYIETVLETGIAGLVVLLFMLLAPLVIALSKGTRSFVAVMVVMVVVVMNIFEVMLNRQMGVQFIALVYCLLILGVGSRMPKRLSSV